MFWIQSLLCFLLVDKYLLIYRLNDYDVHCFCCRRQCDDAPCSLHLYFHLDLIPFLNNQIVIINSYCACLPSYLEYNPLSTLRSTYGKVLTEGYISRFFVVKRNKNYYDSRRESYILSWAWRYILCNNFHIIKLKK